jgi:hypothetical protein
MPRIHEFSYIIEEMVNCIFLVVSFLNIHIIAYSDIYQNNKS